MDIQHLKNTIKDLETRFSVPMPKRDDTLKLIPGNDIVEKYKEMKKILAKKILDKFYDKTSSIINPFNYI